MPADPIDAAVVVLMNHPALLADPSMIADRATARRVVEDLVEAMRAASGTTEVDDDLAVIVQFVTWAEEKGASGLDWKDKHALLFTMVREKLDPLVERVGLSFSSRVMRDAYQYEVSELLSALTALKARILAEKGGT